MNKNSTKVILLLSIVLILGLFFWGWSVLKERSKIEEKGEAVSNLSSEEQKFLLLRKQCPLPQGFLINICRYSPLQRVFPVSEKREITVDNEKHSVFLLRFGDLDIFKINFKELFQNQDYREITKDIPIEARFCVKFSPRLAKMIVLPEEKFKLIAPHIACTRGKVSPISLGIVSFIGYINYPENENGAQYIDIYQIPEMIKLANIDDWNTNYFRLKYLVQLFPAVIEK